MKSATQLLLNKAYQQIWHRGEDYADKKHVLVETHDDREIHAAVQGTQIYKIHLKFAGGGISRKCDCPYFAKNRTICKHIVAVAIVWDERRGISRPRVDQVEYETIPPPESTSIDFESLFDQPLEADLELVRIFPEETALGGYGRPHSRLPDMPKIKADEKQPLEPAELAKCYAEMIRWTRRNAYDFYFCAGEMIAAFCEVLRIILKRLEATPPLSAAQVLAEAVDFHRTLVTELIDDSQGLREFTIVHLQEIYDYLLELHENGPDMKKIKHCLRDFNRDLTEY